MRNFSDFNIQINRFEGKKIEMDDVIDQDIQILDYKIEPSKYPEKGNGLRLTLQIKFEGKNRIIFTSSVILQEQCIKVRAVDGFPFTAKIISLKPKGFKFI
ncbi:hypothetical protein KO02_12475 [Sphingobacterium sp. ML3W]|uniref:hypothetical protein n=1 Tax=Sphingobacterium sp. ML3W TaxID=1538644 RepID=UPI0004F7710E|nr:hypothetical protein [Sphingobacterium sp. ML3W]AIM37413.1 hypothetical protein KO02_12475 [Sphingobacterium sp. ML3W]